MGWTGKGQAPEAHVDMQQAKRNRHAPLGNDKCSNVSIVLAGGSAVGRLL